MIVKILGNPGNRNVTYLSTVQALHDAKHRLFIFNVGEMGTGSTDTHIQSNLIESSENGDTNTREMVYPHQILIALNNGELRDEH